MTGNITKIHGVGRAGGLAPSAVFVARDRETHFEGFRGEIVARKPGDVMDCLRRVEEAVADGLHAAGYLAYEAAAAFDSALSVYPPDTLPLVWFGLYESRRVVNKTTAIPGGMFRTGDWIPEIERPEYERAILRIKDLIGAGDTYQVNYTFGLTAEFAGDPYAWFQAMCRAQNGDHAAYIDLGPFQVVSASPELFFRLDGSVLETRPMKGTRPRGLTKASDARLRDELARSEKDRAENLMIVDLLRNDMGRISETGSVEVTDLFRVERYGTVWQMVTGIRSRIHHNVPDIFRALFPSGSVTGAPKVRAMQIIHELEQSARGVYCGTVGWWSAERQAQFNVGIRTAVVDQTASLARYCVGGGITWESSPEGEYEECLTKSAILSAAASNSSNRCCSTSSISS